jgi:hypothetical protein
MTEPTPINKFAPFDPARVRDIVAAFDDACRAVPKQPASDKVRDILAKCITEAAQRGDGTARNFAMMRLHISRN